MEWLDVIIGNISPGWVWLQIILVDVVLIPFIFQIKFSRYRITRFCYYPFTNGILIAIILIFCVFSTFDGDWFSYRKTFRILCNAVINNTQLEDVYVWIIHNLTLNSYIIFRLIIWGGALFFYNLAFKRLHIDKPLIWIVFILTSLINISYLRCALGYGIFLYGYTFLISPGNHKVRSILYGFFVIILSLFFHKSMYVIVFAGLASLVPIKKWLLLIMILSFPLLMYMFQTIFLSQLDMEAGGMIYLTHGEAIIGSGIQIFYYLCYSYVYITMFMLSKDFLKKRLPYAIEKVYLTSVYALILFALCYFVFEVNGIGGSYLSNRIYIMIYTVFPVLFYYQLNNKMSKKINFVLIIISALAINYRLLYALYLQNLDPSMLG